MNKVSKIGNLTPNQVEYLAQDELITIIPRFSLPQVRLIQGEYGPFEPMTEIQVPLWVALSLHKRRKCKIIPPIWLNLDHLKHKLNLEREEGKTLQPFPFHQMEIALLLLDNAPEDIEHAQQVRTTLEDIWSRRTDKVQEAPPKPDRVAFKFDKNISAMEINKLRGFFIESMNQFDSVLREKE